MTRHDRVPSGKRGVAVAALLASIGLLAVTLTVPVSALAGVKPGRYSGNSTRGADEPVSFKVNKKKKKSGKGKGKKKTKVKGFKIEDVMVACTTSSLDPGVPREQFMDVLDVVKFGNAKLRKNGKFKARKKTVENPESGIVARARGKVSGRNGKGSFRVRSESFNGLDTIECRAPKTKWKGRRAGSKAGGRCTVEDPHGSGQELRVKVTKGKLSCAKATRVFERFYSEFRDEAMIGKWTCRRPFNVKAGISASCVRDNGDVIEARFK